ncbi:glycosyltransferase [Glaciecola sp. HTCC2999]|uniref:glycosyltransferase n=1 Tax=Glaciecola sp. HTCC2999 TaxID=455436 RepID=UPI0000E0F606|nr:glycosyltransferase [Glaciecola sp. HTCC2999]
MNILFIHQNFPGQYKHIAPALAERGHDVKAIGMCDFKSNDKITYHRYQNKRGTTANAHPWVIDYEAKIIRGEACANLCKSLLDDGYTPDVICVHPGWGEALFLKDVWPEAKQLHFVEFYYGSTGRDVDFDKEFPTLNFAGKCRLTSKNTNNLMNLITMDAGMSPTRWQHSTVPEQFHEKISVIHDGIDTKVLSPDKSVSFQAKSVAGNVVHFDQSKQVITFINRNLEPSRGYHSFMRALPMIMAQNPEAKVVIIGGDGVSYGKAPEKGTWKNIFLDEVKEDIDLDRLFFLGRIPYHVYLSVMRLSACHVYLTYPFVLSWSMLEALSIGAPVLASSTPPVLEVIEDNKNGWLVDFFDYEAIAKQTTAILNKPKADIERVTLAARETVVEKYDLELVCLPKQVALIENLIDGGHQINHH